LVADIDSAMAVDEPVHNRWRTPGIQGTTHQVLWTARIPKSSFAKGLAARSQDR
jgi:hypothetical protein